MKVKTTSDSDCVGCGGVGRVPIPFRKWWQVWRPLSKPCVVCDGSGITHRELRICIGHLNAPSFYCGDFDRPESPSVVARCVEKLVRAMAEQGDLAMTLRIELRMMSDREVDRLRQAIC